MKQELNQIKLSRKLILALAAHWDKDPRTIRTWFKNDDPMLTHPQSHKIIIQHAKKETT
jgi:hypothetical protein